MTIVSGNITNNNVSAQNQNLSTVPMGNTMDVSSAANVSNICNGSSIATTPLTYPTVPYYPCNYSVPQANQNSTTGAPPSAVNIIINNPTATPAGANVSNMYNTMGNPNNPCGAVAAYPASYYTQPQPSVPSSDEIARTYLASAAVKSEEKEAPKEEPKKTKQKDIVQLTDDYVKTLENYMNNSDLEIRKMGAKELLARFEEHDSRKNDIALTNLLNKALQDRSQAIRFIAMNALSAGYADGDQKTIDILKKMQQSDAVYGEDATFASEILLKLAQNKVKVTVPDNTPAPKEAKA